MVPRQLSPKQTLRTASKALAAVVTVVVGALLPGGRADAIPVNDPGPFWPLRTAHAGAAYRDALPTGARYALASGALPTGLRIDAAGAITGTTQQTGVFRAVVTARESSGLSYPVRLALSVRRADESDVAAPATSATSFEGDGPYQTTAEDLVLDVTSTFDQSRTRTRIRLARPVGAPGARPLLLFHRGRGFDHDDYHAFHGHLASWGIAVASVEDRLSFAGETIQAESWSYDAQRAELGMLSASGVVEVVGEWLLARAADAQDPLFRAFDPDDLFFAGHSRGGGAVHASHQRSFQLRLKGAIYLMAFDLRYFEEVAPPGVAPAYPIFTDHPRTPALVIAAENDGDLTYPIADELVDRATGPLTQVTVYGAVHNLISDDHGSDGDDRISRDQETRRVADWIVCFIKRWAEDDARQDGRLYGGQHQASSTAAVSGWLPSARTLLLEDAQDADAARNKVGRNLVSNLRRREASVYPDAGFLGGLGLKHTLLTPTADQSVWRIGSDRPIDSRAHRRLVLRLAQTSAHGWSGLGVWIRLVDQAGVEAWQRVHEPSQGGLLPAHDTLSPRDRFIDVHVPLSGFAASTGTFDRGAVIAVDLVLVRRNASRVRSVAVDAVRLE